MFGSGSLTACLGLGWGLGFGLGLRQMCSSWSSLNVAWSKFPIIQSGGWLSCLVPHISINWLPLSGLVGVTHWTGIDIEALGKLSCLRDSLLRLIQRNLGRKVRVNVFNIQLLEGPSQGIETVLKITGSFVCILWLCFLELIVEGRLNTMKTGKRPRSVS